ncbi:sugar ABC transporter ATP-binding protein [Ruegeria atlantica]|uniref:Galactose/methyl galactoside import ATP-binding protein MglA n=1 Tax=Ruegeria atlantica TaxID=81569 RepID=A0A0P1EXH4_9RHOB|nr:sugar ABC transporter ATP-binding protein [Ruegeria atlantica]CUH45539.1 Galactose/methyl galactoside import ATP-binding protein MglA [Ruegeria atlantica]
MTSASILDPSNRPPLIRLDAVSKSFGANVVLNHLEFELRPGEVHALCGENGAGKSTCLGLLYGLHQPSEGRILCDNNECRIENPSHAQSLGVSYVFQELSLAGALSVAENIYAGRAPTRLGVVDWPELRRRAEALLAEFGLDIDVSIPVDSLPISTRQIVEIAKALSLNSRVLLLDEPTSALAPDEVDALFDVLRGLTKKGIGIVYVSHHMDEIFRISDRITVLRDGRHISTLSVNETSQEQVVAEMIGGGHPGDVCRSVNTSGNDILTVKGLTHPGEFEDISFSIRAGEIVGMAGLMGARRSEIVRSIVGLMQGAEGIVELRGVPVKLKSLRHAMRFGVGFVPEERKTEGLFLEQSLSDNLIAASLSEHASLGIMRKASIKKASNAAIDAFSVKASGITEDVGALSGGNQQKIMLAKWLKRTPDLLIVEEPTKGVDVGAKFQIHTELLRQAAEGMAILVVSSDFPELVSLSSRILVVHEGRLMGDIAAEDASESVLLQMAAGNANRSAAQPSQQKGVAS